MSLIEPFNPIPYPSLHEISDRFPPVRWLWPAWIPRGMLTLLGAAPGVGKSLVALDLARRIIHGLPFPDGAPVPCPGSRVLVVDAEGAPALLNQRAEAWAIDCRYLYLMSSPDRSGFIDLAQPQQVKKLGHMIHAIDPALVIVDSLAAATSRGETSLQSARAILGALAALARMKQVALLVIHHLRKRPRPGWSTLDHQVVADDLRGSSHLSAAARSVLALSVLSPPPQSCPEGTRRIPDPSSTDPDSARPPSPLDPLRRLEVIKTNICRPPPPLTLRFEGGGLQVPTLHYSEYVEPPAQPTQLELCAQWLLGYLAAAGEPLRPAAIVRAAREEGFTRPTLYRARQALAGTVIDLGTGPYDPRKRWTLAPEPSPPRAEE